MCVRIQFAPRHEIVDPWDRDRNVVTLSDDLSATALFTLLAVQAVLQQLGIEQDPFGARCWCGEPIELLEHIPQQQRSGQVVTHGA